MPAHIYQRVGRYADAARSNEMAIAADEDYISQCRAQGLYPMAYYPHNLHFLWFAATAEGRSKLAIDAARKTASQVNDETLKAVPLLAGFRVVPYFALTRFGKWDEMLREPEPPATSAYMRGTCHYARGTAFVGKGQTGRGRRGTGKVERVNGGQVARSPLFSPNTGKAILVDRAGSFGRRDCRVEKELRRGRRASRTGSATGRCTGLHRAIRISLSAATRVRRNPVGSKPRPPKPRLFTGKT